MQRGPGRGRVPDHQNPGAAIGKGVAVSPGQFGRATTAPTHSRCQLRLCTVAERTRRRPMSRSPRRAPLPPAPVVQTSWVPAVGTTGRAKEAPSRSARRKVNRRTLNYFRWLVRQRPTTYAATHKATCLSGCAQA